MKSQRLFKGMQFPIYLLLRRELQIPREQEKRSNAGANMDARLQHSGMTFFSNLVTKLQLGHAYAFKAPALSNE